MSNDIDNKTAERHIDSDDSSYTVDHQTDRGGVAVAEREDTNANPVGAWREREVPTGVPPFVLEDFNLTERVNPATGELRRFLNPRPDVVQALIKDAPNRVRKGIDDLTAEDGELVAVLAKDMKSLIETAGCIDEFFANGLQYNFANEIARAAVRATRWRKQAIGWASRLRDEQDHPDGLQNLINMVQGSNRRAALIYLAMQDVDPAFEVKYDGAAWNDMRAEANRHARTYLGAERNTRDGKAHESSASRALAESL